MPRRRAITEAQLEAMLALPADENHLIRHWTLDGADRIAVERRRGGHNQLGFALQLCAFRYPGRLLRPGEAIPEQALRFVAEQLRIEPGTLAAYAARPQTRREQLDALREEFGFRMFGPGHGRDLLAWLLPVALATTNTPAIAAALMDELRRRRIVAPGPSVVERLIAAVLVVAERHVADQLTKDLSMEQVDALDALLRSKTGTPTSVLAWARQPPTAPGHRALARIVEQLTCLRAIGLTPAIAEGVHPERLRRLAREGARFKAQHLRNLSPLRRRATLVATVLDTVTRLTDDGVAMFDRAVGRMFRRAEAREEEAVLRDARAVNDKVRLFARLGAALLEAKGDGTDLDGAVAGSVGWERLARSIAEANELVRPDKADLLALAARAWPVLHRLGPLFLGTFQLRAAPAAASTLRAVELLQIAYGNSGRKWPGSLPVSFLPPAWRDAVLNADRADNDERRTWEAATLPGMPGIQQLEQAQTGWFLQLRDGTAEVGLRRVRNSRRRRGGTGQHDGPKRFHVKLAQDTSGSSRPPSGNGQPCTRQASRERNGAGGCKGSLELRHAYDRGGAISSPEEPTEAEATGVENIKAPPIGPLIQRVRKERRLTLEQLASMSGVSKSMLSQVERGQANPTYAVLWSLTRALKLEFANLVNGQPAPEAAGKVEVVSAAHTPEISSTDGSCRLRILSSPSLAGQVEWYNVEIAPSGILDCAPHAPGTFEHFTALSGGFAVTSGTSTRPIEAGETARYPADVPHSIANTAAASSTGMLVVLYRQGR